MRYFIIPASLFLAAPVSAKPLVPLAPPVGNAVHSIGAGPRTVPADHPLRGRIAVEPVAAMPRRVGTLFVSVAKPAEFDTALKLALEQSGMLAAPQAAPKARLHVTWRWLDAPAKIGSSARAKVAVAYELRRIDTGQAIFQREVTSEARTTGGRDASLRLRHNARKAIQRNIAAAVICLDLAAYGRAPGDCAPGRAEGRIVSR
ncbi:MAG TPA: hypothetical protein VF688_14700 [Allosphingosinicella sp.]|jgi:hypothetical protein